VEQLGQHIETAEVQNLRPDNCGRCRSDDNHMRRVTIFGEIAEQVSPGPRLIAKQRRCSTSTKPDKATFTTSDGRLEPDASVSIASQATGHNWRLVPSMVIKVIATALRGLRVDCGNGSPQPWTEPQNWDTRNWHTLQRKDLRVAKKRAIGRYPLVFRKMAVERLKGYDNVLALAKELGVHQFAIKPLLRARSKAQQRNQSDISPGTN
jgi:hypothetical protein